MRRTATLSGSLLLALAGLHAQAQQRPASLDERVRALARAADDAAREKALQAFDAFPISNLAAIGAAGERQGAEAKEAVRRWLPHRAWVGILPGTLGDARRKEAELLGPDAKRDAGGFARGVQGLLKSKDDRATRVLAVRLLKNLPLSDPAELLALLEGSDRELKRLAAEALHGRVGPESAARILPCFIAGGAETDPAVGRLLASLAGPDAAPALLELAEAHPIRALQAVRLVGTVGDASAEPGLLALFEKTRDPALAVTLVEALSQVGTRASIGPIRRFLGALPPDDPKRLPCRQALLGLRDPALAGEILEDLREGRADLRAVSGELARLGAREAVPLLVAKLEGRLRIEERNRVLESLGRLGGPAEVERILPYLEDERHVEAAASALLDLGDPRAAGPLARALRLAGPRSAVARALLLLPAPLEGAEEPLLEILDDPDGHASFEDALRVAARSKSAKLKEKILSCIPERAWRMRSWTAVWEALPGLRPEDRETLVRRRPDERPAGHHGFLLALAATGDEESLKLLISQAVGQRLSLRHPYEPDRMLELPGLRAAIEEAFRLHSGWVEGAEWLALHGDASGAGLLRDHLRSQAGGTHVHAARALLRLGDPAARDPLVAFFEREGAGEYPLCGEERDFARSLDEESAARLRAALLSSPPMNQRAAFRILAWRGDPAALALFRSQVRSSPAGFSLEEAHAGPALAAAGAASLRPDFLRMLRSPNPGRRTVAARGLGLLGDRDAVEALLPLLDDLQAEPQGMRRPDRLYPHSGSVSDAAAEAIERLAGRAFEGPRARRVEAIRAWARETR